MNERTTDATEALTADQRTYMDELVVSKRKQLWTAQWELAFMAEYHKDWMNPASLMNARSMLGKAREMKATAEDIARLENEVTQIKECLRVTDALAYAIGDLTQQIGYFEDRLKK